MFWIAILLCLGINSSQAKKHETGVWGLSGFECDANWEAWNSRAGNKKDCERYRREGWCTEDGDYGASWRWGEFEQWAEKKCKDGECTKDEVGRTALACPQCGCRVVAKDAPQNKKIKYKILEVGTKTYVRVVSFRWRAKNTKALNWYEARERCQRLGYKHGDLASIPTDEERQEITKKLVIKEDPLCGANWIGLKMDNFANDKNEWRFRWLTGEFADMTRGWIKGRPAAFWNAEEPPADYPELANKIPCGILSSNPEIAGYGLMLEQPCDLERANICSYLCHVSDTDAADAIVAAHKADDAPADDN